MARIIIIGAGPAGARCAHSLAKAGHEVDIYEEHSTVGKPVQCTGLVTQTFEKIIPHTEDFLVNTLTKVRAHAPDGNQTEIKTKELVLDRMKLDQYLIKKAQGAGANIHIEHRAIKIQHDKQTNKNTITFTNKEKTKKVYCDILIGADGPMSLVAQSINVPKQRFWFGIQALVKIPVEKDTYQTYFGDNFPRFFGWSVPESKEYTRIGIASEEKSRIYFESLMKKFPEGKIVEMQGGLIPQYNPKIKIQERNTYLVGDAATQVKATTGGGIIPGMLAAEALSKSIIEDKDYRTLLKPVEHELKISLMIRKTLNRFTDKDYNKLIKILNKDKIKKVLAENDRDNPSKIIFKAIIAEPGLLLFARTLIRHQAR
jgi:geranylgeranyl reductase family protein